MDNIKTFVIGVLAVLTALAGASFFNDSPVGGSSGPDHYFAEFFNAGITVGGGITSTSTTAATATLLARDFDEETTVDVTMNGGTALTLSFPASSTLTSFIPKIGDTKTLFIRNATTTASTTIILSGGTGVLLKTMSATSSKTIYGDTDGANYAKVDLVRKANTDIEALATFFTD